MISLIPMTEFDYQAFLAAAINGYAQDNIDSGRWTIDDAIERSTIETTGYLPQGLQTADNYLYNINCIDSDLTVGYLWAASEEKYGHQSMFVCDIEIKTNFRRQGYAAAAFCELEAITARMGIDRIGLHVFGHNEAAQALYKKLGYEVTGINTQKKLGA